MENKIEIINDVTDDKTSIIQLTYNPARFSFVLRGKDNNSKVDGYVDLTPEELEAFKSAFSRMIKNPIYD